MIPEPLSSLKLGAWSLRLFLNFILTHTCLLKNTYEQNLAQCIGAPQSADFSHYSWSQITGDAISVNQPVIRDQLLSCAGGPSSLQPYRAIQIWIATWTIVGQFPQLQHLIP